MLQMRGLQNGNEGKIMTGDPKTKIMDEIRATYKKLRWAKKKGDKENERYLRLRISELRKHIEEVV